jgi:hypothetical protein
MSQFNVSFSFKQVGKRWDATARSQGDGTEYTAGGNGSDLSFAIVGACRMLMDQPGFIQQVIRASSPVAADQSPAVEGPKYPHPFFRNRLLIGVQCVATSGRTARRPCVPKVLLGVSVGPDKYDPGRMVMYRSYAVVYGDDGSEGQENEKYLQPQDES